MPRPTPEFLRAVSAFRRYAHPERLVDWEQRFGFGLADIEQVFEAAVAPATAPVLSAPGAVPIESFPAGRYVPSPVPGELVSASAAQIAGQVRNRKLSVVEIAELFLGRIEAHRHLNAFITVNPALTMEQAHGLDHRLKRGEDIGPLAGVPVGVKDLMSVRGYPLTAGTRAIEARVQERDAPVVASRTHHLDRDTINKLPMLFVRAGFRPSAEHRDRQQGGFSLKCSGHRVTSKQDRRMIAEVFEPCHLWKLQEYHSRQAP